MKVCLRLTQRICVLYEHFKNGNCSKNCNMKDMAGDLSDCHIKIDQFLFLYRLSIAIWSNIMGLILFGWMGKFGLLQCGCGGIFSVYLGLDDFYGHSCGYVPRRRLQCTTSKSKLSFTILIIELFFQES